MSETMNMPIMNMPIIEGFKIKQLKSLRKSKFNITKYHTKAEKERVAKLAKDIADNGLLFAIRVKHNIVDDGWARVLALQLLGFDRIYIVDSTIIPTDLPKEARAYFKKLLKDALFVESKPKNHKLPEEARDCFKVS